MQLKELGGVLARRWYLTVVGLCATVVLGGLTFQMMPPTFETQANVLLLPPETSVGEGGNPYLYLGGLDQAVDVVTRALTSDSASTSVLASVVGGSYEALPDWSTSGPIVLVTARGSSPQIADATREAVLALVPSTLKTLQDALNVSTDSRITSMVLTADDAPTPVLKERVRAAAAAGFVALIGSSLLIGLVDGLLVGRARRRNAAGLVSARMEASSGSPDPATVTATGDDPGEAEPRPGDRGSGSGLSAEPLAKDPDAGPVFLRQGLEQQLVDRDRGHETDDTKTRGPDTDVDENEGSDDRLVTTPHQRAGDSAASARA